MYVSMKKKSILINYGDTKIWKEIDLPFARMFVYIVY